MSKALITSMLQRVPFLLEADIEAFVALWRRSVTLKRGDFLIREGQVEHNLYFVVEGVMRIYLPLETEEIVVGFAYDKTLVCSFPSFVDNRPSDYCIQALKKAELLAISRDDLLALLDANANLGRFWRMQVEQALVGRIEREIDLLLPEPERRLQRLMARSPHLFQIVPKKYIASYLRMTPESLSRLRC
jgi:CRP-like cAMP-binding protein